MGTLNSLYDQMGATNAGDEGAAEEQEVSTGTIDTIRTLFASQSAAFASSSCFSICPAAPSSPPSTAISVDPPYATVAIGISLLVLVLMWFYVNSS